MKEVNVNIQLVWTHMDVDANMIVNIAMLNRY